MAIYAIADLHLSFEQNKPMNILEIIGIIIRKNKRKLDKQSKRR